MGLRVLLYLETMVCLCSQSEPFMVHSSLINENASVIL